MKRPSMWRGQRSKDWPKKAAEVQLSPAERKRVVTWPLPAHSVVRFSQEDNYFVDVELALVENMVPVNRDGTQQELRERWIVTGIAVRRGYKTKRQPHGDEPVAWEDDLSLELSLEDPVSTRDVRRMPFASLVRQALAVEKAWTPEQIAEAVSVPRGRPGLGTEFYKGIADSYRGFEAQGKPHPAREIAKRKRVPENRVHRWVWVARELGVLEESQYSGKRRKREGR